MERRKGKEVREIVCMLGGSGSSRTAAGKGLKRVCMLNERVTEELRSFACRPVI